MGTKNTACISSNPDHVVIYQETVQTTPEKKKKYIYSGTNTYTIATTATICIATLIWLTYILVAHKFSSKLHLESKNNQGNCTVSTSPYEQPEPMKSEGNGTVSTSPNRQLESRNADSNGTEDAPPKLPHLEPNKSDRKTLFFVETSCVGPGTRQRRPCVIDERETCAVESAARIYPDWNVTLIHTCPLQKTSKRCARVDAAFRHYSVTLVYAEPKDYLADTPVYRWASDKCLASPGCLPKYADVVFPLVALWKHGGLYLGLNVISFRSFGDRRNVFMFEKDELPNTAVIHLSSSGFGHEIAQELLTTLDNELENLTSFVPDPNILIKSILLKNIAGNKTNDCDCAEVTILNSTAFDALTDVQMCFLFNKSRDNDVRRLLGSSYGLCLKRIADKPWTSFQKLLKNYYCPHIAGDSSHKKCLAFMLLALGIYFLFLFIFILDS